MRALTARYFFFAILSLAAILYPFAPAAHAQRGQGTEFGLEDDFIVLGDTGTWQDPDVEIKGFTVFGNNLIGPQMITPSTGSVVMRGNLQVDATSYFGSSVTIAGQAQAWSLSVSSNSFFASTVTVSNLIVAANAFSVGGSTFVITSGNVGIGTTNPAAKLHVQDSADSGQGFIRATNFNPIPSAQWPTFDGTAPYLLQYALWVGWDDTNKAWKYYRDASNTRGLTDPGNPNTWTINGAGIGYFDGNLDILPSGTHINNKYDPRAMAARCGQDDIQVKVGSIWVDKYAVRIIDVGSNYSGSTLKDDAVDCDASGDKPICSGQEMSPYWMAFSQKLRASTGMTWFMAYAAATNTGKDMLSNTDWQKAAAGTAQTTGNSQTNGRDWSSAAPDAELSRYGVAGMAGNLWEWVADWGQYGEFRNPTADKGVRQAWNKNKTTGLYEGVPTDWDGDTWSGAWPAGYGGDGVWGIGGGPIWDGYTWASQGTPSALVRGGAWYYGALAGVFAMSAVDGPANWYDGSGFRCGSKK